MTSTEASPLILSASAMSTWLTCHKQYLYSNVYRIPGAPNVAMVLGTAVHAAAEAFWKSPRRPHSIFKEVFDKEIETALIDEDADTARTDGEKMVGAYMAHVAPTFKATMVEEPFLITINGIGFSGMLDAADESMDDVHDLKTTNGKTVAGRKPKFDPRSYGVQLNGYGIGYEWLTGRKPKRLLLDVITRLGRYRQYELPIAVGEFIDTLGLTSDGILSGDYEPTGALSGACNWCPYVSICKDAKVN